GHLTYAGFSHRRDAFGMRQLAWIAASFALACGGALPQDTSAADLKPPDATVVLVHGMGGFQKIDGIDYFWHVPALYRSLGATVIVPGTTTFASSEKRAAELKSQLDATSGPLILLGHSQRGLDARWLGTSLGHGGRVEGVV